jgi:lipopolysaccharide/colanic/teichoic acid biosynthesis glycosyltransferase
MRRAIYSERLKPALDRVLAITALIVLSPLLILIAALVRAKLGSPVIFWQVRPGKNAKPFRLCKFRTMTDERDSAGTLLPDAQRLTRFGWLLRASSVDELPELWNIARGEMSFIGPRPLLTQYLPLYTEHQARRHDVRPGITGWAQINGRNELAWDDRFEHDVWYVDHCSLAVDLAILWRTVRVLLGREGISAAGHATCPPFQGASDLRAA